MVYSFTIALLENWALGLWTMARANTAKMGGRQAQGEAPGHLRF